MKRILQIGGLGCGGIIVVMLLFAVVAVAMPQDGEPVAESPVTAVDSGSEASVQKPVEAPEYVPLNPILSEFETMTDIQQDSWNVQNEWKYWVTGTCMVDEVRETNLFSEITDMPFEITCDIDGSGRPVLFMSEERRDFVMGLSTGDVVDFQGRLKSIKDWEFWTSAFIVVE